MTVAVTLCDSPEMGIRSQSGAKAGLLGRGPPLTSREIEFDTTVEQVLVYFPPNIKRRRQNSPVQHDA